MKRVFIYRIKSVFYISRFHIIFAAMLNNTMPMMSLTCSRLSFSVINHAPAIAPRAEPKAVTPNRGVLMFPMVAWPMNPENEEKVFLWGCDQRSFCDSNPDV